MSPTLHAVQLLAMPAAAGICALIWRPTKPTALQVGLTLSGVLVIGFVAMALTHACSAGNPITQPIIGAVSLLVAGFLIGNWKVRALLCIGLILMSAHVSDEYGDMVHKEGLTGNRQMNRRQLDYMRKELVDRLASAPIVHSPSGWLWTITGCKIEEDECITTKRKLGRFWHSAFTRLYPYTNSEVALWFTGGIPSEARIEWRKYP